MVKDQSGSVIYVNFKKKKLPIVYECSCGCQKYNILENYKIVCDVCGLSLPVDVEKKIACHLNEAGDK